MYSIHHSCAFSLSLLNDFYESTMRQKYFRCSTSVVSITNIKVISQHRSSNPLFKLIITWGVLKFSNICELCNNSSSLFTCNLKFFAFLHWKDYFGDCHSQLASLSVSLSVQPLLRIIWRNLVSGWNERHVFLTSSFQADQSLACSQQAFVKNNHNSDGYLINHKDWELRPVHVICWHIKCHDKVEVHLAVWWTLSLHWVHQLE